MKSMAAAASEVAAELAEFPEVFAAHLVTGRYDIDMLVALHDFDELSDLMLNKFSKVRGIRSMTPAIAVDVVKYQFDVAPIEGRADGMSAPVARRSRPPADRHLVAAMRAYQTARSRPIWA